MKDFSPCSPPALRTQVAFMGQKLGWGMEMASCSCKSTASFPWPGERVLVPFLARHQHLCGSRWFCPGLAVSSSVPKWDGGTPALGCHGVDQEHLGVSKGFLGTQPLEPWCPCADKTQPPFGTDHQQHSGGVTYSIFQSGVVQRLNCCWPLKTWQKLPRDANTAPFGWCDLSAELPEGEQVLAYQLITMVLCPQKSLSGSVGCRSRLCCANTHHTCSCGCVFIMCGVCSLGCVCPQGAAGCCC